MELPIEFKKAAGVSKLYEQGATDMLNAVEAMLKKRLAECTKKVETKTIVQTEEERAVMYGIAYLDNLLTDLQSIKPL
jgi:hypothetical protein